MTTAAYGGTLIPEDYKLVWSDEFSVDGPPRFQQMGL